MNSKLSWVGLVLGLLGIVTVLAGLIGRFYGDAPFMGFRAINWIILGIALLTMANWAKLYAKGPQ